MVDIIIPVYNALDTLELAVTSALMQGDVRILLVDDGSTDGTARLCDELAHHPRIEVIHQRNHGVSAARNAGLQAAASEWLTFLDADDVLLPDAIGNLLALAGDSQAIQGLVTRSEALMCRNVPFKPSLRVICWTWRCEIQPCIYTRTAGCCGGKYVTKGSTNRCGLGRMASG